LRTTAEFDKIFSKKEETPMGRKILCSLLILFVLSPFLSLQELQAAAPYYEGKVINIIVGFSPGGGYDRLSRILAKHLPKFIPGKPTILVQNMPGAGSIIAANQIYNLAKPDGLTLGTFNRGLAFAQLLKAEGVKFDLTKYPWIGSAAIETATLALRTDLPFKTVDDILKAKEPIMIGSAGGPSDSNTQFILLLKEFLKLNVKIINYPASAEVMLAVERKEVDGRGASFTSIKPFVDRNLVRCWIRGRFAEPGIENLPVDEDLTPNKVGKTIMSMRSAADGIGRPYVAPPGTPANIMSILREAFAKVIQDPEAREDARKNMMELEFVPAEECLKLVNFVLNQPEDIVKEASKYIKF
jgi:tripartite-type tricarboxylate transporter receptor subunit TctC